MPSPEAGPLGEAEKRWTIYECPECGNVEGDFLWDATVREEHGMPCCPYGAVHGQLEMRAIGVVPAALLEAERARADEQENRARGFAEKWGNGLERRQAAEAQLAAERERAERYAEALDYIAVVNDALRPSAELAVRTIATMRNRARSALAQEGKRDG